MTIELSSLWDFSAPAVSEQRFRDAALGASPEDVFLLHTQIARTWGLRGEFAKAREILAAIEPDLAQASSEGQARWFLESGRTWASPAHPRALRTPESRERARPLYTRAFEVARDAALDGLAIDALHMMAMVDEDPDQQIAWDQKAIAYMESSAQPTAKRWAGALYNNVGYAMKLAGRHDDAIANFRQSLTAYEAAGQTNSVRIAHWMIASVMRAQGKLQEALAIQLRLEREREAAGEPSPFVYGELEALHRALGNTEAAEHYRSLLESLKVR